MVLSTHVNSIAELIEAVKESQFASRPLWYRGQAGASWPLQPSIQRRARVQGPLGENNVVQRFRTRASVRHPNTPAYEDRSAWLSLMQHYRLPTRLLDWSRSPLVAAYFAVEAHLPEVRERQLQPRCGVNQQAHDDAVIWILDPHELNRRVAGASYTLSIQSRECADLIDGAFYPPKPPTGDQKSSSKPDVLAVMAYETDLRMFVQQGSFTIHEWSQQTLDKRSDARHFLQKLVIPGDVVDDLAAEVEICGLVEGDIYPNLEHLSTELTHLLE